MPRWPGETRLNERARAQVDQAAKQILSGFSMLGTPIGGAQRTDWHTDPLTGHRWPQVHWTRLRLRDGPDPKPTWALHRLQHLALLALGGPEAREVALAELRSWLDENPPWIGIGWASGLEVACRTVSLLRLADALHGYLPHALVSGLRSALLAHGIWLERHPSLYSSANNHRLAEVAALILLGATTDLPGARRWLEQGRRALAEVLPTLILADGGGGEMSVRYLAFALEWALVARRATSLGAEVDRRIGLGAAHLCALLDGIEAPAIGDDDGGVVLAQGFPEEAYVCSVAGAAGAVLGEPDRVPAAWTPDLRACLLGAPGVRGRAPTRGRSFPVSGLTVLTSVEEGTRGRWRVVVDHGPLGWPALAAHGHADALAVVASADGRPVLVGCGTYRYRGSGGWRRWFRGTGAHNTVLVGGLDSSEPADDPFLWRSRARAWLERVRLDGRGGAVTGAHDGYLRRLGVLHRRSVSLEEHVLTLIDRLEGRGSQRVVLPLHLAPDLDVRRAGVGTWELQRKDQAQPIGWITASLHGEPVRRDPSDGPGPGVWSPSYGELEPGLTLWLSGTVRLPWRHVLRIVLRQASPEHEPPHEAP